MVYNKKDLEKRIKEHAKWVDYDKAYHNPTRGMRDYELVLKLGTEFYKKYPEICPNPQGDYFKQPHVHESDADAFIKIERKNAKNSITDYVNENLNPILERLLKLNPGALYEYVLALPARKTGEGKHDDIADIYSNIKKMYSLLGNKENGTTPDISGMEEYIQTNILRKDKSLLMLYQIIVSGNASKVEEIFRHSIVRNLGKLRAMFLDKEGKLDNHSLKKYVRSTLDDIKVKEGKESYLLEDAYFNLAHQMYNKEE